MNYRERAVKYLATGLKSEKQVRDYLARKEATKEEVDEAIAFLKDLGYLDDVKYARSVFEREYEKGRGKRRTVMYLRDKGLSSSDIEEGFSQLEETYDERKMAQEIASKMEGLDKAKVARRLAQRGFAPQVIYSVLEDYETV
ncbi:MAG: recombination regulator RecX [Clostridia bacterium]|nr:recombination regulator RecX [Clostridia bacterium]